MTSSWVPTIQAVAIFIVATVISSIIMENMHLLKNQNIIIESTECSKCIEQRSIDIDQQSPTFAIYNKGPEEYHLKHVLKILHLMGLKRVTVEDDWDLLWSHDFPFRVIPLKNLKPHQKVNHFPGCGFITNKVDLSTSDLPFLPKAFKLPSDKQKLMNYKKDNPRKLFVEKHNEHRHIYIKSIDNINLDSNNSFVQEFIDKPFLVDGHKFDVGVYVIVTSVNPLRVYIHTADVLFRYCMEKYYPFNATDTAKYVVGDDYLPTWEVPSLRNFYNDFQFGMKGSFDAYVQTKNKDPKIVWLQVENIIRETILAKENNIIDILKVYKTKNFFELMRFDLIIQEDLKVYLMEANMSPNLSSAHFKQNTLLYEQLLYSMMQLVGVGVPVVRNNFERRDNDLESIISSEKNLAIDSETCYKNLCHETCKSDVCRLCLTCLTEKELNILHESYREHIHRADNKRIFPTPIVNLSDFNIDRETTKLSPENKFITRWFYGKCKMESTWCT